MAGGIDERSLQVRSTVLSWIFLDLLVALDQAFTFLLISLSLCTKYEIRGLFFGWKILYQMSH